VTLCAKIHVASSTMDEEEGEASAAAHLRHSLKKWISVRRAGRFSQKQLPAEDKAHFRVRNCKSSVVTS
jgi:hypothetical protein